jgi:hypothetical protein
VALGSMKLKNRNPFALVSATANKIGSNASIEASEAGPRHTAITVSPTHAKALRSITIGSASGSVTGSRSKRGPNRASHASSSEGASALQMRRPIVARARSST